VRLPDARVRRRAGTGTPGDVILVHVTLHDDISTPGQRRSTGHRGERRIEDRVASRPSTHSELPSGYLPFLSPPEQ